MDIYQVCSSCAPWAKIGPPKVSLGTWPAFNRYLYVSFKQNSGEQFRTSWPSCFILSIRMLIFWFWHLNKINEASFFLFKSEKTQMRGIWNRWGRAWETINFFWPYVIMASKTMLHAQWQILYIFKTKMWFQNDFYVIRYKESNIHAPVLLN